MKPEPFREQDFEVFWKPEDFDRFLPQPGFLTDFVLTLRGIETPTVFAFWTGIFLLSSTLKRDVFLKWYPENIYPNFYIMLVAPPKVCAKSTTISFSTKLLMEVPSLLEGPLRYRKLPNIISTRATPESLSDALLPGEFKYTEGTIIRTIQKDSELAIIASEASTFLGKQKYNLGLIDRLTHLYDCREEDQDRTRKDGVMQFRNTYVTFISATTPEGVRTSIPEEAFEGGFMSRLIIVYQDHATRVFPFPRPVGPSKTDLLERLAWIAGNALGGYELAPEARLEHERWYMDFHKTLESADTRSAKKQTMYHRFDIHLLKLALVLRCQRYEPGKIVSMEDYMQARRLLEATLERDHVPIEDIGASNYDQHYSRIKTLLKRKPMDRRSLLQAMSPYRCYTDEVSKIVDSLSSEGVVSISFGNRQETSTSKNTKELYTWVGKEP